MRGTHRRRPSAGSLVLNQSVGSIWRRLVKEPLKLLFPNRLGLYIMPTVDRIQGLRVVIYPNDHRPAHVHVIGGGCEAVFDLGLEAVGPSLRENFGFTLVELNRVQQELARRASELRGHWRTIHGHH